MAVSSSWSPISTTVPPGAVAIIPWLRTALVPTASMTTSTPPGKRARVALTVSSLRALMVWVAPHSRATARRLSAISLLMMVRTPRALAAAMAHNPMGPAPRMRTVLSGLGCASPTACTVQASGSHNEPAMSETWSGSAQQRLAGMVMYWAKAPGRCALSSLRLRQRCSSLRWQRSHCPHDTSGLNVTRCPIWAGVPSYKRPFPATMVPAPSCPMMSGGKRMLLSPR